MNKRVGATEQDGREREEKYERLKKQKNMNPHLLAEWIYLRFIFTGMVQVDQTSLK